MATPARATSKPSVERIELAKNWIRYRGDCEIEWRRLARGVVWVRCIGRDDGAISPFAIRDWQAELHACGKLQMFLDLRQQTGMGTVARDEYMAFGKQARGRGGGMALVSNRVLDLTIAVISMFVGSQVLSSTSDLSTFRKAIRDRAPDFEDLDRLVPESLAKNA